MRRKKDRLLSRLLRFAAWACLAVIVAASFGVVWLDQLVTPEWLKASIISELQDTFHRPVKITRVNLLLHQGIKVSGLEVRESEDFPGDVFLSSDFLIAKYSLTALLRGRIELSKVLLMSPRISLVRRADGVWNLQDMLQFSASAERKGKTLALPPLQVADVISIEGGELRLRDLAGQRDLSIADFRLLVKDFNITRPFSIQMSFANKDRIGDKRVRAEVSLSAKMSLADKGTLEAQRLRVTVDGQTLSASGNVESFSHPSIDLRVNAPPVDSVFLAHYFSVPAGIRIPASRWHVKAALQSGEYHLERIEASAGGVRLNAGGILRPSGPDSRLTVVFPQFDVREAADFYEGWSEKRLSGAASGSLTLSGPIRAPSLDRLGLTLKSFSAILRKTQRVSEAELVLSARDGLKDMSVLVSRGTYVAYGNALSGAAADLRVQDGNMAVRRLAFTWNGSRAEMRGCVRDLADPKEVTVVASVDKLRVDEFYDAINSLIAQRKAESGQPHGPDRPWAQVFKYSIPTSFPDSRGRLRISQAYSPNFTTKNLELLWTLKGISKGLSQVGGDVRVSFGDGRVSNVPAVREAHRLLNVLLFPFTYMHELNAKAVLSLDTATPMTLDFKRIAANFSVRKGLADVHSLNVDSGQFVAFSDGKVDLPGEKTDLRVLMRLPKQRGQLPDRMVDTLGRPSIELYLKDDLNKPTPELTLRKMESNDIEEALAAGLKRGRAPLSIDEKQVCGREL